jgi:hypothetical protein
MQETKRGWSLDFELGLLFYYPMKILVLALMIFMSACAHDKKRYSLPRDTQSLVTSELKLSCGGDCWVDQCWQEQDTVYCDVGFAHTSVVKQKTILAKLSDKIPIEQEPMAFCPRDSMGTQIGKAAGAVGLVAAAVVVSGASSNLSSAHSGGHRYYYPYATSLDVVEDSGTQNGVCSLPPPYLN